MSSHRIVKKRRATTFEPYFAAASSARLVSHRKHGSAMAELPLAMMVLLILLFFPSLDLLFLGIVYNAGSTLNDLQLRQASMSRYQAAQSPTGPVKHLIPEAWKSSGIGKFAKLDGEIDTAVSYSNGIVDENGLQEKYVRVTTKMSVNPFLKIPLPVGVPGLNAPAGLTFSAERPMEDPTKAPPGVQ